MKRTRADLIQAWLLKAHKDVVFAGEALDKGEDYTDIACFHAQQAAEKTLKAYLVWLGVESPKPMCSKTCWTSSPARTPPWRIGGACCSR